MSKGLRLFLLVCFSILIAKMSFAQPAPRGPVILEVRNDVSSNAPKITRFDLEMLERIGLKEIVTETPWTIGPVTFKGILLRDLMATVATKETSIIATAMNDYSVRIPVKDYTSYDVLLATRRDGEILTVRDKGPIWLIYPWSNNPNLKKQLFYSRSIWQLKAISVQSD
jgi:hypothetical protein